MRACLLVACLIAAPVFAQEPQQQTTLPPRTVEQTVEATATVTAIDKATREVSLKTEDGETTKIVVGPEVTRFDEIAVGDTVRAKYTVGITSELRAPTEEEKKEPFVAVEGGGRGEASAPPSAGAARMFRIVATITAIDSTAQTATLKGPNDNYVTVQVDDPARLASAKVGDTVVVTAAESVVLSLEKTSAKKKK